MDTSSVLCQDKNCSLRASACARVKQHRWLRVSNKFWSWFCCWYTGVPREVSDLNAAQKVLAVTPVQKNGRTPRRSNIESGTMRLDMFVRPSQCETSDLFHLHTCTMFERTARKQVQREHRSEWNNLHAPLSDWEIFVWWTEADRKRSTCSKRSRRIVLQDFTSIFANTQIQEVCRQIKVAKTNVMTRLALGQVGLEVMLCRKCELSDTSSQRKGIRESDHVFCRISA